jgi:predicted PurR-regulated permease PerM
MDKEKKSDEARMKLSIRTAMRIGFIALLLALSFGIIRPFLAPVAWGIIFSVAIYPLHVKFARRLGDRTKLSAVLISLIGISIIVVPTIFFTSSTVESVGKTVQAIEDETLEVPPPNEKVKDWPLIGERTYAFWASANESMTATLQKYAPQLKELSPKLRKAISGLLGSLLLFIISLAIAGALLLQAGPGKKAADQIFTAFVGDRGEDLTGLSIATIRSVVAGVIGIAVIQTLFLSLGMFVIHVPAAGVLAIVVLIVCIIQLPPILVMLPVIIYVFSIADTVPAVIFTVWSVLWSLADSFLKPMFLGKGVPVPMLVILLGAIGGMMMGGPVGLFVGSVALALTYKIFMAMLKESDEEQQAA